jgi:hypothetical protein
MQQVLGYSVCKPGSRSCRCWHDRARRRERLPARHVANGRTSGLLDDGSEPVVALTDGLQAGYSSPPGAPRASAARPPTKRHRGGAMGPREGAGARPSDAGPGLRLDALDLRAELAPLAGDVVHRIRGRQPNKEFAAIRAADALDHEGFSAGAAFSVRDTTRHRDMSVSTLIVRTAEPPGSADPTLACPAEPGLA